MKNTLPTVPRRALAQAGFTLVEMMVAMAIGLVVVLGFTTTFVSMKTTFGAQNQLTQLQDNERLAMSILTAAVQQAGFYPDPLKAGANAQIIRTLDPSGTPAGGQMDFGQAIAGTPAIPGGAPETLSTAFASKATDGLLTCQGTIVDATSAPGGTALSVRDIFYVDQDPADPTRKALFCRVLANDSTTQAGGGKGQALVSGVEKMTVLYGLDNGNGIEVYKDAATVNAVELGSVKAVRITLDFTNPFAKQLGLSSATIPWTQTINLMNKK